MIEALITSKTRIKLLIKFFINPAVKAYLRELAQEFNESTNAVRIELNRLTDAGILQSYIEGNKVFYQASIRHPFFPEIKSIINKFTGLEQIVEHIVGKMGNLQNVYLIGDYAKGIDSGTIEIVLTGDVNTEYLKYLITKSEREIHRNIHYYITDKNNIKNLMNGNNAILLWSKVK